MKTKEIAFKSLHVSHLNHNDAVALFQSTCEIALPVRMHIGSTANAILEELVANTEVCYAQVNRLRESPLSGQVKDLRKGCNDLLWEIKRCIRFNALSSNAGMSMPANELKFFFKPNWNLHKKALATQMELTSKMLMRFMADEELVKAGQIIGIDTLMINLEIINTRLEALYCSRINEVGSRPPSGTDLRPAANESYMQFCTAIEQAARYTPNDELLQLFNRMKVFRRESHRLLALKQNPVLV